MFLIGLAMLRAMLREQLHFLKVDWGISIFQLRDD